jgi:DNA-binding response OmpR family regulator
MDVITAEDGTAGLRQLVDHLLELDLLVTDLNMPGLDGVTLVRVIRAEGGEWELPIIVLASTISPADREVLTRLSVNALLEKQAGPDPVVARAKALVAEARARRAPKPATLPEESVPVARIAVQRAGPV